MSGPDATPLLGAERAEGPRPGAGAGRGAGEAAVRRLLDAALVRTGLETAWVAELAGGEQWFRYVEGARGCAPVEGTSAPLDGSYHARLLDGGFAHVVPDAVGDPSSGALPVPRPLAIGSYVGVPVRLDDGELLGLLVCVGTEPAPVLDDRAVGFLEALAMLIGVELRHRTEAHRAAERRHRAIVEALEVGLEIVFQPIVDLRTAAIVGAEALARFASAPADPEIWFSDAADVELGHDLQLAAVAEALRHLDELPDDVYLAVNASPAVILHPRFQELIATVPPERLVVELTEHAAVDDYDELARVLGGIRERGVRLAIDDAGAGFSSFRHVLRLRPDIIKLDMSITRDVDSDPVRRALAEAMVTFAGEIGASIVAEGVETRGELDALLALGASSAQGFFLRRPAVLPLPDQVPGPTPRIMFLPPDGTTVATGGAGRGLGGLVAPMLDATLALTDLSTAYLAVLDPVTDEMVVTHVSSIGGERISVGRRVPREQSLSKICQDRGIQWTAEVPLDLGDRSSSDVQTYVSVPVEAPDGRYLGTLAASSLERRYLDAATYGRIQIFARSIGERLAEFDAAAAD